MESGRLCFDPYASQGNQFFLGNQRDNVFPGVRTTMMMEESSKRRPFFSSPEELLDEDYYDEQLPEKKRRLSPDQVHLLEKSFETENKLEPERKTQLAKKLGLQPRQVAVWFQNRRARWKTKQLERDYDLLKTSLDSLRSNYDSLLKDNQILKSQVVSLTNKLEGKENNDGRETAGEKAADLFSGDRPAVVAAELKMEDRLSTGSGSGSAVVNDRRQFVDSSGADSYFRNEEEEYTAGGGVNRIDQSEEGDGSDDGRSYFSDDVFCATDQQQQLGWWVWP